ncbi:methyltransferase domain-containing protein [Romeria aff. gracilis LEGE 07310]|uniref:Methyltransferase domain-containing protein n=1 Tax=Vasconcelosia minhoensis LEGE 07310 TaxID=915328 RepID=A0A8J7AJI2_9CYAN|nr:methyltransferase domain-containing protein [Romeria gracilis]MBE9076530.1 methyltransferase domain-containing protein [Romeria aff. gracilis LEGE 07310]
MSADLKQRIQQFYDQSSGLWEQVWGEHMHHGYYGPSGRQRKGRRQAQIDLIETLLAWGGVRSPQTILDVGCGIGGSTLYLAQKYSAAAVGITLSPVQAERAAARAGSAGIPLSPIETQTANAPSRTQAFFQVADAQSTPFADQTFDFIWSMESGEHMPDKRQFLQESYRLLQPGGLFLMATWCHRPTDSLAGPLTADEQRHLEAIYRAYCLPYVISLPEYGAIASDLGFTDLSTTDWTAAVEPFWGDVIASAFEPSTFQALLRSGGAPLQGAFSLQLMSQGFSRGLLRYGILAGKKAA